MEACFNETTGDDTAALEHEFRLSAKEERADFQHPFCGRQPNACAPRFPKSLHEVPIRQRIWRCHIDHAIDRVSGDQEVNALQEILIVNPRDKLDTASRPASQPKSNKTKQCIKYTATVGTHNHRTAERDLTGVRRRGVEESRLPASCDIDAEFPRGRRVRFVATDFSCLLVHGSVITVAVNRRGTCVHPQARWMC